MRAIEWLSSVLTMSVAGWTIFAGWQDVHTSLRPSVYLNFLGLCLLMAPIRLVCPEYPRERSISSSCSRTPGRVLRGSLRIQQRREASGFVLRPISPAD